MIDFVTIFVLTVAAVCGRGVPGVDEVNAAIVDLNLHYNQNVCLELLLVDCATHLTVADEQICGSNGITYPNHCRYAHAVCEYLSSSSPLTLASRGPCPMTTNSLQPSTTDPLASAIQNVFCSNADSIDCNTGYDVVCGSDGLMYPNRCELSKAQCSDRTLTMLPDLSGCAGKRRR